MKPYGLLFQNGDVTKFDLGFLHTVPFMVACEAVKEFVNNHDRVDCICENCLTSKKFSKRFGPNIGTTSQGSLGVLNRLTSIVESAKEIVRDNSTRSKILYWIEEPMYKHERVCSFLESVATILQNNDDYETRNFLLTEAVPFKLTDFHYSHERNVFDTEGKYYGKMTPYINQVWDLVLEGYYEDIPGKVQRSIEELNKIIQVPEKVCNNLYDGIIYGTNREHEMKISYESGPDDLPSLDRWVKINTDSFTVNPDLTDKEKDICRKLVTYKARNTKIKELTQKGIKYLLTIQDRLYVKIMFLHCAYPLVSSEQVNILMIDMTGKIYLCGMKDDNTLYLVNYIGETPCLTTIDIPEDFSESDVIMK